MRTNGERTFKCSCGRRHSTLPSVADIIDKHGPMMKLPDGEGRWYWVERIFVAHHRPYTKEVMVFARMYDWRLAPPPRRVMDAP